jgi:hypothetical protein
MNNCITDHDENECASYVIQHDPSMIRVCHGRKGYCAIQGEHIIRALNGLDNSCHALCYDNMLLIQNLEINYIMVLGSVTLVL